MRVRRALISVSDKTGLAELAEGLASMGVTIVSTGRTAHFLARAGVPVTPVADVTDGSLPKTVRDLVRDPEAWISH